MAADRNLKTHGDARSQVDRIVQSCISDERLLSAGRALEMELLQALNAVSPINNSWTAIEIRLQKERLTLKP